MSKNDNNNIIIIGKANDLIEAKYKFNIWESRFFYSVLAQIQTQDAGPKKYRIYYRDIIDTFNCSSKSSYKLLREAASTLMDRRVYIKDEDNDSPYIRRTEYRILKNINYITQEDNQDRIIDENQQYIDVTIDNDLIPYLFQLKDNFTTYYLQYIVNLTPHSTHIYELLKQYEKIGHRKIGVSQIKSLLCIEGKYKNFSDFYRSVIEKSVKEINKHTDIHIIPQKGDKRGRKYESISFQIISQNKYKTLKSTTTYGQEMAIVRLTKYKVFHNRAVNIVQEIKNAEGFEDMYVEALIQVYESTAKKTNAALFVTWIDNNDVLNKSSAEFWEIKRLFDLEKKKLPGVSLMRREKSTKMTAAEYKANYYKNSDKAIKQ